MTSPALTSVIRSEKKLLLKSAGTAFMLEVMFILIVGMMLGGRFFHGHSVKPDDFVEAELVQMPSEAHLISQELVVAKAPEEAAISKVAGQGKKAKSDQAKQEEQNQAQGGPILGATHGAVVLYAPAPVIPVYLREKEINTSVVIEFSVTSRGTVIPRLLSSSGNEELDAIALATVKKWQFRPAEKEHQAVDSKLRLRILFQVY